MINNNRLPAIGLNELYMSGCGPLSSSHTHEIEWYGQGWDGSSHLMVIGRMPGTAMCL